SSFLPPMSIVCDRCRKGSVIFIRYSGQHLCATHFMDLLRRRLRKEARSQKLLKGKKRIGVALSGGKDSLLALKLTNELIEPFRDVELVALTIDEGISGYRPSSIGIAKRLTKELGIRWELLSFKAFYGLDLDEMVRRSGTGPCTICGILRRQALNRLARETEVDVLVTGHNLDDMAQTVLMNVMSADLQRLVRMGPHMEVVPGLIPRSMPLRTTPETETYLAAHLLDLPIHEPECPYSERAHRRVFQDILLRAERDTPGTRHSLLRFHEQVLPLVPRSNAAFGRCSRCSEPVIDNGSMDRCKACQILDMLGAGR
ncbi:MAG: adenine nucleotide alpha hydrolase family protein, partial [Candidatus Thermoplasmatota archaeon]|nr:adenine nucleotide alpha hydrolase family protein [Candidatus Thermoplasmatota archaeon]